MIPPIAFVLAPFLAAGALAAAPPILPAGIAAVRGECEGIVTITPTLEVDGKFVDSKALRYDCANRRFEALQIPNRAADQPLGDFTLSREGAYVHLFRSVDRVRMGEWRVFDLQGRETRVIKREDLDVHELILKPDRTLYMKYVPRRDAADCLKPVPIDLVLAEEDSRGNVVWSWNSRGRIEPSARVMTHNSLLALPESTPVPKDTSLRGRYRPFRDWYSCHLMRYFKLSTPGLFFFDQKFPLYQIDMDDHIHANSVQELPDGNLLVSGRSIDSVFLVNRKTSAIDWVLGGPFSRIATLAIEGDPRGGFSHQHTPLLHGTTLWLFDNANKLPDKPSRAVAYALDTERRRATFITELLEPNGRTRLANGSIMLVPGEKLLVGWGAVKAPDKKNSQRAVSVFDLRSRTEIFAIDFAPGYQSYRAKWSPAAP